MADLNLPAPLVYPELVGLTYDVIRRPTFSNETGPHVSGREARVGYYAGQPIWEWDLTYGVLRDFQVGAIPSELKRLEGLFLDVRGSLDGFLFKDPDDHSVVGQVLGLNLIGSFDIVRTFGDVALGVIVTEPVRVDLSSPFHVYVNGILQSPSSYAVVPGGVQEINLLKFSGGVPSGVVTVDMDYYFWARFSEDYLDFENFAHLFWLLRKVTIRSQRMMGHVPLPLPPPLPPPPPPGPPLGAPTFVNNTAFQYKNVGYLSNTVTPSSPLFFGITAIHQQAPLLVALIGSVGLGAPPATVNRVNDDFGLTWRRRSAFSGVTTPSGTASNMEVWWADSRSLPVDMPIQVTATYNGVAYRPMINVVAVVGSVAFPNVWDTNGSLPRKSGANDTAPQVSGISTNAANSLLIAWLVTPEAAGSFRRVAAVSDNGWTNLVGLADGGGLYWLEARNVLLTTVLNFTAVPFEANFSLDPNINPAGLGYLMIVDAVAGT